MSAALEPRPLDVLTVGSLCSGYLGADAALATVLDCETRWVADNDSDVTTLLAQRTSAPNLGDITSVDWTAVEQVRLICAGFPCQDISPAGRRKGIAPDTRSGLWTWIAYVIDTIKPDYVFIENSKGLTHAKAHSDVESCPWCMGDVDAQPALRALGRVLGDLADLGYDTEWCCVHASDVGAPHERARAFVWAWRRDLADPGCVVFRRRPDDGDAAPGARAIEAGKQSGQRVRADARDDSDDTADAAGVRGGSRGQPAPGQAGGASDLSERRDRAHDEPADAGARGRQARRSGSARAQTPQRRRAARASDDTERRRSGGADADPASERRGERRAERPRVERGSDDARSRSAVADAGGAGLEVGREQSARDERAPAQRDRRDWPAPPADADDQPGAGELGGAAADARVRAGGHAAVAVRDAADVERERARPTRDARGQAGSEHDSDAAADADSERRESWQRDEIWREIWRAIAGRRHAGDAPEGFIWRVGDDDFTASIKAWEVITLRPAPLPAVPNRRGDWRLNPRFSEWMMGLPDGWVTAVEGLSRAAQLRIIGNGLVPAQGALALDILTSRAAELPDTL